MSVTEGELVQGWTTGFETTIRLATGSDVEAMGPLIELTGAPFDDYLATQLRSDGLAGGLRMGLRSGHEALMQDVAAASVAVTDGDIRPLYLRSALPLVAEHPVDGIVGALLAYPPTNVVERYYTAAARDGLKAQYKVALGGAISLIKIKAVAVADHARGHGLGTQLLQRCEQVYRQCRFRLLYGQIPPDSAAESFYARHGFEVKPLGGHLDLWVIFGTQGGVYADHGERLFAKWID